MSCTPLTAAATPAAESADELLVQAETARLHGDYENGARLAERAVAAARAAADAPSLAAGLQLLAEQRIRTGHTESAVVCSEEAIGLWRHLDEHARLVSALTVHALAYLDLGLMQEALDALDEARKFAAELDDPILLFSVHNRVGTVLIEMGNYESGRSALLRGLTLVDDDPERLFCIHNNIGDAAIKLVWARESQDEPGDVPSTAAVVQEGLQHIDAALELARGAQHPYREALSLLNQAMLRAHAGDTTSAWAAIDQASAIATDHGYTSLSVTADQHAARIAVLDADAEHAIRRYSAALEGACAAGETSVVIDALRGLVSQYEVIGDYRAALENQKSLHTIERRWRTEMAALRVRLLHRDVELADARDAEREARREAHTDPLTGLLNRRGLDELLSASLVDRAGPVCAVVVDLDHFKSVNDEYGHATGDAVLARFADVLTTGRRAGDLVARLGGEEFLLVLATPLPDAKRLCERLRESLLATEWTDTAGAALARTVTASFGVAKARPGDTPAELIARADAQLYAAKRRGRNRVEATV